MVYYKLDPNQILQEHVDEEHRGVINGVQVFKLPRNSQPPKSHLDKNSTLVGTRRNGQLYKKRQPDLNRRRVNIQNESNLLLKIIFSNTS
jgi:hypothetical protein